MKSLRRKIRPALQSAFSLAMTFALGLGPATAAFAQQSAEDLALQLSNPVAALISVPLQLNYDQNIGDSDAGERWTLNVQPVIPIELNDDWNLISRTIVPLVAQDDIFNGSGSQGGIGDIVQSVFFSPKAPTSSGWIVGAGPVMLLPTGTDELLSAEKWGGGPTGVMLKQQGPWTYGALANHIWSFAGDDDRNDISSTFIQPFISYTTPNAVTFALNTESTYDWKNEDWTVPINLTATKVTTIGNQLVSYGGGLRYWADGPGSVPEDFGVRFIFTLLYPR